MVLQSGFGCGRDRLELKGEAAGLVAWPAPFPGNGFEPLMQAWQVVAGFAALAQQRGGQQSAEPRRVLKRFDRGPRLCRDRCRKRRRQRAALCDEGTPRVEPGVLVPVGIVDQRVPFGTLS